MITALDEAIAVRDLRLKLDEFLMYGDAVPSYMHASIIAYVVAGVPTGEFLQGIITKDLGKCISHADSANIRLLHVYYGFFYNHTPAPCWGDKVKMNNWIKIRGLLGE